MASEVHIRAIMLMLYSCLSLSLANFIERTRNYKESVSALNQALRSALLKSGLHSLESKDSSGLPMKLGSDMLRDEVEANPQQTGIELSPRLGAVESCC